MPPKPNSPGGLGTLSDVEYLKDLELQNDAQLQTKRLSERLTVRIKVLMQPANSSELGKFKAQGVTGDISKGGCRILFPVPVQVGDIYRLEFDKAELALPLVFARCLRCRLVHEDAYEAGFAFFTNISLQLEAPAKSASSSKDLFA